jgi:alpha-mannosidase
LKKIHLVCNAHLDPVWLWEWPEGAGEALSTFRTAAEFCEHEDGFIFCHNEALLYQWAEEYEPALFKRIQTLVAKGKWNILGGWFLQPDSNMPSGESFVRQVLLGKRYFKEKFGVDVKTGANLDPFGHTRGLVQILAKSGYHSYLFCRPDRAFAALPADEFVWVGYDGSEIMAARVQAHYNSRGGGARAKVEDWMKTHPDKGLSVLLWGIGDHGGGASKRDLADLKELMTSTPDFEIVHSTAEAYFEELSERKDALPRHADDINPWAVGCYTTMARVKQRHRRLENEIYGAEKMASAAAFQGLMKYPETELRSAIRDLAFAEFHDILPGSSIEPVEEGAIRLLDHGLEMASRVKAGAFFALAAGEKPPEDGEIPIFVYNPHPFKIDGIISCEFQDHEPNFEGGYLTPKIFRKGRPLPCQPEKELSNLSLEWRKKVVFAAELEPGRMNRFSCRLEKSGVKPSPILKEANGIIHFKTRDLEVDISAATGLIERCRIDGADFLAPGAFRPLVIADNADPWGMSVRAFRSVVGAFTLLDPENGTRFSGVSQGLLPSVRIIEEGEVRTIVEAVLGYGNSFICLRYKLPKKGTEIEIEARLLWNEKDKMLKLSVPTHLGPGRYLGQTAYGVEELPSTGDEAVSQKWAAVVSNEKALALTLINDGVYGSDFADGEIRISLVRSPAHSADPAGERPLLHQDRFIPRIDQGQHVFRFWINGGKSNERLEAVDREALVKNEKPYVLPYFPPGNKKKARPCALLSDPAVQIAALKKAEQGKDLIIRLFEPTGRDRTFELTLPMLRAETMVALKGFEIKTLRFDKKTKAFREVDLLEEPL